MPNIVEGEPGIFPDPVARVLRGIASVFRRPARPPRDGGTTGPTPTTEPDPPDTTDPPADGTGH